MKVAFSGQRESKWLMNVMKARITNPHHFIILVSEFSKTLPLFMTLPKGKVLYILENKHIRYEHEDSNNNLVLC